MSTEEMPQFDFTPVTLDSFFDTEEPDTLSIKMGITLLTPHQEALTRKLVAALRQRAPEKVPVLEKRINDMQLLSTAIAQFPSLLETATLNTTVRTPRALIDNLVSYQEEGDTLLHMPSKAELGKGFLVAKIHSFFSMTKLAKEYAGMSEKEVKEYNDETVTMMFTLLAEDVYLNLIRDKTIKTELRRKLAEALITLWEHRSDQTFTDVAPILQSVWSARRTLAPAFGTMMGTSELLLVSIQMDSQWTQFIKDRLGDSDVSQAMEEFLFGLSYEQITRLRGILKSQGVKAIGRDEVSAYLGERVKTDISLDYRDFYLLYTVRRDNARARQRLRITGPKKTLEDHFIRYVMETAQEQQLSGMLLGGGDKKQDDTGHGSE